MEIGIIDFQGLWEGWKAGFLAFHAFHTLSFPWPVFETHLQNHNHFEGAFGEQYLLSEVPTIRSEPQRRPKRNLETCLGLWAKTETESLGLLRFERSINLIETG